MPYIYSNFRTNNANIMSNMFLGCVSLTKLDISNFNTNNVKYMEYMFCNCKLLKELNISSFNVKNTRRREHMFDECLEELKEKVLTIITGEENG